MEKLRGGSRPNSGRKPGSGRYGCKTVPVRVPAHLVESVEQFCTSIIKLQKQSEEKGWEVMDWHIVAKRGEANG